MKTKIFILILAALGVLGCQTDNEDTGPVGNDGTKLVQVSFTTTMQDAQTRTGIVQDGDTYKCVWTQTDALGVYVATDNEETTTENAKFSVSAINSETGEATFVGYIRVPEEGEADCKIYYYYPYLATAGKSNDLQLSIPVEQVPGEKGIDPKAHVMMGKPLEGKLSATGITSDDMNIMFIHKTTFLQFKFGSCTAAGVNAATEKVKFFKIEKGPGAGAMAGKGSWLNAQTNYNDNNTNFSYNGYENSTSIVLAIPEAEQVTLDKFEGWITTPNFSATGNTQSVREDKFYITIVTDAHTIKKTWIPVRMAEERTIYFRSGEVNRLNLNIDNTYTVTTDTEKPVAKFAEVTEVAADMSGEYIIAATPDNGTTWYVPRNKDDKSIIMVPTSLIVDKTAVYDVNNVLFNNKIVVAKTVGQPGYSMKFSTNSMSMAYYLAPKKDKDGSKTYGLDFQYSLDNSNLTTYWDFSLSGGKWGIENQTTSTEYGGGKYIRFYKESDDAYYLYGYESQSTTSPYFDIRLFKRVN